MSAPRPAEEPDVLTNDELMDAISMGEESWFWPVDGEKATVADVLRDLAATRSRLAAVERERDQYRDALADRDEEIARVEAREAELRARLEAVREWCEHNLRDEQMVELSDNLAAPSPQEAGQ